MFLFKLKFLTLEAEALFLKDKYKILLGFVWKKNKFRALVELINVLEYKTNYTPSDIPICRTGLVYFKSIKCITCDSLYGSHRCLVVSEKTNFA